jgi:hypothetical protein
MSLEQTLKLTSFSKSEVLGSVLHLYLDVLLDSSISADPTYHAKIGVAQQIPTNMDALVCPVPLIDSGFMKQGSIAECLIESTAIKTSCEDYTFGLIEGISST